MVLDNARADVVDPAVQMQDLFVPPRILNNRSLCEVKHLFLNVFLYKPVPSLLFILDGVKLSLMITINILNNSNPVVDYTYGAAVHSCLHTSAAIVTANNNMAYFESVYGEIKNTKQVQISVHDHVRDVSVNEDFTWLGTDNDVSGDSAVRAPNPKNRWSLSLRLFEEKLWVDL